MPSGTSAMHKCAKRTIRWWESLQKILDELDYDPERAPTCNEVGEQQRNLFEVFLETDARERLRRAILNLMQLFPFPKLGLRFPLGDRQQTSIEELRLALESAVVSLNEPQGKARDFLEVADALLLSSELLYMQAEILGLDKFATRMLRQRSDSASGRPPLESGVFDRRETLARIQGDKH